VLSWEDQKDSRLEKRLRDVVIGVAIAGEELRRERVRRHEEWLRQEEVRKQREAVVQRQERERREREHVAAEKQARIDALLNDARNLELAHRLRTYVDRVLASAPRGATAEDLQTWAAFVRSQADALDPTTSGRLVQSIGEAVDHRNASAKAAQSGSSPARFKKRLARVWKR